jgi:hypothetical protein
VKAIVPEVQLEAGWIGITPPPGLLELGHEASQTRDETDDENRT